MVEVAAITDENFKKVELSLLKPVRSDLTENKLEILAGPILRFWGLGENNTTWRGAVAYVTRDANSNYAEFPAFELDGAPHADAPYKYAQEHGQSFWRFDFEVPLATTGSRKVTYQLGNEHNQYSFAVPGQDETMRTMFYSCNGFSLGVDTSNFPGSLWDDVLRQTKEKPIHVMLGGGDQLYCDWIETVLPENAVVSRDHFKDDKLMEKLIDQSYIFMYTNWYGRGFWKGLHGSTEQRGFVEAIAQIASLNIYDDHDIIDGFGTYRDGTMKSPIFKMIGTYAYKYYMLFQQLVAPENDPKLSDPSWISTGKPGPYIAYPAQSIYARLGKSAAFIGLDCRTERKKNQVVSPEHYKAMFARLRQEIEADPRIKHVYLMLGVPIAYPRMVWAENLMSSRMIGPIKWLSRHGIILKGLVNPFDGDVELLDDLNDHWTAKHHKRERNHFLKQLMALQRELSVRVTILGGDVHLCAVGVFGSLSHHVSPEKDPAFMVCPVSSAIVNASPPSMLADFLNRRNHTHILDSHARERLLPIFADDTNGEPIPHNHTTMARRNYCLLDPVPEPAADIAAEPQYPGPAFDSARQSHLLKHNVAIKVVPDSVKMSLMVEKDNLNADAETVEYSMYIPALNLRTKQE